MTDRLKMGVYTAALVAIYALGIASFGWRDGSIAFLGVVIVAAIVSRT